MKYLFRGTVFIPNGRIGSETARVPLKGGANFPPGELVVQIKENAILAEFETASALTEVAIASVRIFVKDVAAALCRCLAVLEGTWAIALVTSAESPDGTRTIFDEVTQPLKHEFVASGISSRDLEKITAHPQGFYLRNAIDNIAIGLLEPKFNRVHFYCAIEALRTSMAPDREERQQWEIFRSTLGITRDQISVLSDNALRHGDYANASSFTSAEREAAIRFVGQVICRYVEWFKRKKLISAEESN